MRLGSLPLQLDPAIDDHVARPPANLLVVGACHRLHALEFVLGRATKHVLRATPTVLFLSH
ncbi:MAG: hypothetical protein J7521_04275 [Caulobacter sp.]|nr:hypothetical protein [Caulobacter sp.]